MKVKVAILGCSGRMGRNLIQAAVEHKSIELVGGTVRASSSFVNFDLGELAGIGAIGQKTATNLNDLLDADVFIDFTAIQTTLDNLKWCQQHHKALVIGTTGFSDEQVSIIEKAGELMPVILAPNTSVGVNLMFKLLEVTAKAIGDYTDIEIFEAHHRFKKDAPSGTAVKMGQVIADTLGRDLNKVAVYGREGITGERDKETIGFATVRAGDIVGEHTAFFADIGERLEITHRASSRMTFALGAMRAAFWLSEADNGFYDMQDVLGLK
ncbi:MULTISPECIES: 4-hydroxy-tetrahydrodipicolinate reductase [unclassified Colwellia]|jgi:4-hydroxy-tetrahydrodipicolinate reductase|uniref:4-hydroxy-tetrahydrodipicolinate reductase n=1 Tax=unclassified Colwellia TaxID=196834 RepID=UPI0015F57E87|nr:MULTISPECIES: 4-hydroxy-tetrahydrodipicolinate reductase [unclassified Colwellia]MBA6362623.1 4-hydroxy-tetrahydrodipicolinate reductase [Colwellia sp. BRX8-8]MBA6336195.1 4-hydroxy-tetrahydrodipicolinate reductase [Colwellia sp. BRX8-7]MBA6349335.1 4-hydroxy-tetrahydrodipicolinate reductase [Colwellia sp. BRX8-9]MBA6352437.1 4-hydroxy-tetrahydrodipicolinate reductase [Colwellia sp. BRX9-1]MBA6356439.1 4-hydroxy-tetrahydrodipicolinate reductase [Colwellia sp. BRX8-3]